MDTLRLLIDVLGPVVLIVGIGAVAGPRLGLDIATLSKVAYWVLGPAFIFNIFATTTLDATTALRLAAAGSASVVGAAVIAVVLAPAFALADTAASASIMSSAYGNVGNAGLAIAVFALGEDILDRAGVLMVTIMFLGTLLSVWLGTRQTSTAFTAARRALLSPMILAGIAGFVLNIVGASMPLVVDRAVSTVAGALIPVMLFTLGVQLAAVGTLRWMRSTSLITIAKLMAAPLIGWAVAAALGLGADDRAVVIIQCAMPPAVFCMVLAIEHDLEGERTTNDVVVTTLAALITLPIALVLVT